MEARPADIRVCEYVDATDGIFAERGNFLQDTIFFYEGQDGNHRKSSRESDGFAMEGKTVGGR